MKIAASIILTAFFTAGLVFGSTRFFGGAAQTLSAPVRWEAAERGELIEVITAPGKIEPRTKVAISARVSARIVALPCEEGTQVTRGGDGVEATLLVKLDSTDLEAALEATLARRNAQTASIQVDEARIAGQKADLVGIRAELRQKELELDRHRKLLASRDVSQALVDELEAVVESLAARIESMTHSIEASTRNLRVVQHNIEAADAEIARARDDLEYTTIRSPLDGVVTKINSEVGELAIVGTTNTPGTTIMEVADLSRMLMIAEVDEADIGAVQVGQRAHVRVQAYPDRTFSGTVTHIALVATNEPTKHFEVEIALDTQGDRIYSGLTADADIEIATHTHALRVPSQAVLGHLVDDLPANVSDGNPWVDRGKTVTPVVYRALNGEAVVTPVRIGASDTTHTLILDGLDEGEPVISGPYKVLEHIAHGRKIVDEREVTESQRRAYFQQQMRSGTGVSFRGRR